MTTDNMNVETRDRELIISRIFDAPRELVFEAHSSCEHLKHWWGPRSWPMVECTMDFREGGTWRYCLRGPNEGDASWGKAIYQEIVSPERIVYHDYFSDEEGNINEATPQMLITVEFHNREGKTKLVSTTRFATPEELQKTVEMGALEGMTETWDRLEEHLATTQTAL